jgi:diguanylate cyclase (GGDEF)-like protein/PAS domain S-box-containing protein
VKNIIASKPVKAYVHSNGWNQHQPGEGSAVAMKTQAKPSPQLEQVDLFRSILATNTQFRGILDTRGQFLELNQLALDFLGLSRAEVVGQDFWQGSWWQTEQDRQAIRHMTQDALLGTLGSAEFEIVGKEQRLWTEIVLRPVRNAAGAIVMLLAEGNNISQRKRLEQELLESERQHRLVIEAMSEGVLQFESDGTVSMCNAAAERILGQSRERVIERKEQSDWLVISEDGKPLNVNDPNLPMTKTFRTGEPQSNFVMGTHKSTGELAWVLVNTTPLKHSEDASPYAVIVTITDITEQKKAEQHQRTLITTMSEGLVHQTRDGTITLCNAAAEEILGLSKEQMMGRTSLDPRWRAVHEDGSAFPGETHPAMMTLKTGKAQANVLMGVHKPSGDLTWILINSQPIFTSEQSLPDGVVCTFTDITERKELEDKLRRAALYDALTGLPTRTLLMERLSQALARHKRKTHTTFALLFIDLDNFKTVNDTLGHAAGDAVLIEVAKRLKSNLRETDTVARLGGDEFLVLLEGLESEAAARSFAKRISSTLTITCGAGREAIEVRASIGIAHHDASSVTAQELLARADKAMYRAKAKGTGQVTLW